VSETAASATTPAAQRARARESDVLTGFGGW
jgi:hypothetical protein